MSETIVPMSSYVCSWCGCPYSVPTAIVNNITVRCPNGHGRHSSLSLSDELKAINEDNRQLQRTNNALRRSLASKNGYIARLKAKA